MSQLRGQIEDIEEPADGVEFVGKYYHVPAILALLGFMLWSRTRHWKEFLVEGTVYFSGFDSWYHYRMVKYTIQNWPATSPFDPWTYFPYGTHSSQFGTVMDQLVATAALIVGLGNPSDHTVRLVTLFAPAVFGTLVAIPVYYMGKRTAGKFAGVVAVAVLAFAGSTFAQRGTVGFYDHHVAEALFMSVALLATMVAVSVAEQEKPVWELFQARDVDALRRPVGWSLVAGAAIAVYIWTWAPGVFLIGILGVYFLIEITSEYAHGESPEHVAIAGAVTLGTAGVLSLAVMEEVSLGATSYNLVQPMLAFAVAGGCAFLAWFAREWETRELPNYQYPVAVLGIIAVLAGVTAVALPDLFGFLTNQLTRVIGLSTSDTAGTVAEAQSLPFGDLFPRYRFTLFVALLGVGFVVARHFYDRPRAELTLLAVWTVFMLLATLTQRRFDYYFGIAVATMTAMVIGQLANFAGLSRPDTDIETYQILTIAAVLLVVFAPLLYPSAVAMQVTSAQGGAGPSATAWNESLGWMQDNTPREGNFGGANNAEEVPYYGTFERTDDFDYPDGFYGVLSWWDYGHYITVMGERIPTANPFQQGASQAANFLLSQSESDANEVIGDLSEDDAEARYVMVDWKMTETAQRYRTGNSAISIGGKYFAPFQFYSDGNISASNYFTQRGNSIYYQTGQGPNSMYRSFTLQHQPYYNSTAVRLYNFHGSAVEPTPLVVDWNIEEVQGQQLRVSNGTIRFDTMAEAREYASNDPTSQVGGVGQFPSERVPALEHYRMVSGSDSQAESSPRYRAGLSKDARGAFQTPLLTRAGLNPQVLNALQPRASNWVKAFERVPGATIEGEGPANATVEAAVPMNVPSTNSTFVYRQQAQTGEDGTFTMTVPYSTTGYDEWGTEEGYTSPSVRADGPYQLRTDMKSNESATFRYVGTANVTEGQVLGEDSGPTEVTLEKGQATPLDINRIDGNETVPGADGDGNQTAPDGNETADTGGDETTTDTGEGSADGATATPGSDGTATPDSDGTATPGSDGTATPADVTATTTDTSSADSSALTAPSAAGPATMLPLFGAGLLSLVALSRRG